MGVLGFCLWLVGLGFFFGLWFVFFFSLFREVINDSIQPDVSLISRINKNINV